MEWIQGSISRQEEIGLIVIYMAEPDMRKSIILVMVDTKSEICSAVFRVLRWLTEISSCPPTSITSIAGRKKLPTFRFYLMIDAHRTVGLQVKSHHERNDRKG